MASTISFLCSIKGLSAPHFSFSPSAYRDPIRLPEQLAQDRQCFCQQRKPDAPSNGGNPQKFHDTQKKDTHIPSSPSTILPPTLLHTVFGSFINDLFLNRRRNRPQARGLSISGPLVHSSRHTTVASPLRPIHISFNNFSFALFGKKRQGSCQLLQTVCCKILLVRSLNARPSFCCFTFQMVQSLVLVAIGSFSGNANMDGKLSFRQDLGIEQEIKWHWVFILETAEDGLRHIWEILCRVWRCGFRVHSNRYTFLYCPFRCVCGCNINFSGCA